MFDYKTWRGFSDVEADFRVLRDAEDDIRLHSLFVERKEIGEVPLYTLKDVESKGYPSAYLVYMTSVDEYDAAIRLVGSMSHWRSLLKLDWFLRGIVTQEFSGLLQWREDMSLRDLSRAKQIIQSSLITEKMTKDGDFSTVIDANSAKKLADMAKDPAHVGAVRKVKSAAKQSPTEAKILELHKKIRKD